MNSEITQTYNYQQLNLKKQKQTKQTTRTGTESQKWRSQGELLAERGKNGGNGTGNKKYKWQVENRQGEVKNSIGNGEAKELICTTHGHELRWGNVGRRGCRVDGKNETTVIA